MGLKHFLKHRKKLKVFREKISELNPAKRPAKLSFEKQVEQAKEFRKRVKPGEVRYSKAKTIRGLIQDLKKGIYPPKSIVEALIKKIKTRGVKSLTREEGILWNMLLEDKKAKHFLERLWQEA